MLPAGDASFVQIVDAAFDDAAVRGGPWLACKPGCNQCCTGVFRISPLDVERLQEGVRLLASSDVARQERVLRRVEAAVQRLSAGFPGDPDSGLLHEDEASAEAFEDFANDEVCPVLDPETGMCDLYAHRPITCRTFGPPVRTEDGSFGVCELCFVGASAETVTASEMMLPDPRVENGLIAHTRRAGETIVAFAFRH